MQSQDPLCKPIFSSFNEVDYHHYTQPSAAPQIVLAPDVAIPDNLLHALPNYPFFYENFLSLSDHTE
jgi:hypothetical protein